MDNNSFTIQEQITEPPLEEDQFSKNIPGKKDQRRNILFIIWLVFLMIVVGTVAYYLGAARKGETSQTFQPTIALSPTPIPSVFYKKDTSVDQTNKVVFTKGGDIWVINSDGTGKKQLTQYGGNFHPLLSPSKEKIAYYSLDASAQTGCFESSKRI